MKQPPNTVLALDVGSRTLLWVEASRQHNRIMWGESDAITLELGRLLNEPELSGKLEDKAIAEIINLSKKYLTRVEMMTGVLTGALRELPITGDKIVEAGRFAGMELRVITAEEEGELAWLGAADLFPKQTGAVLDLGGHSAQLVSGRLGQTTVLGSLPIGCQTMTWKCLHYNPPSPSEIAQLNAYLDNILTKSGWQLDADEPLAIAGGTAAAWASLVAGTATYRPDLIHGLTLTRADGEKLISQLSAFSHQQIAVLLKSDPARAGVFLAGLITIVAVLRYLHREQAIYTARSIRHGLAYRTLGISEAPSLY